MSGQTATARDFAAQPGPVVQRRWRPPGALAGGAIAVSATALGVAAIGAIAIGAIAVGALAVRQVMARRMRARSIVIDQLTVNRLVVRSASQTLRETFEPVGQGSIGQAASARRGMNGHGDRRDARARATMHPGDEAVPGAVGTGETTCPVCGGAGVVGSQRCENCDGAGKVVQAVGGG